MNKVFLLKAIQKHTLESTADIVMPTRFQKGDKEAVSRAAEVHLMRLPDSSAAHKKAPYILHQLLTGVDVQTEGNHEESSAVIRTIFAVYNENEEEGALMLLNLMERLRISLLKERVLDKRYQLDLKPGLEVLVYPDDTSPYYAGEMVSTWIVPSIKREVVSEWL